MLKRLKSSNFQDVQHKVTFHLGWATAIACLGTLQFGYHLAELNATGEFISCQGSTDKSFPPYDKTFWGRKGFNQCINPEGSSPIALLTTLLTIGGLISSTIIGSRTFSTTIGRKQNCLINSILFVIGSCLMATSNTIFMMGAGRFLCGLGAGSSLVISPILVSELTPANHRGFLGSFLQISLATGILLSQTVSIFWANDQKWRYVFVVAAGLGLAQFLLLFTTSESPKWLIFHRNDTQNATSILSNLRSNQRAVKHEINHWRRMSNNPDPGESSETRPLLEQDGDGSIKSTSSADSNANHITVWQYLTSNKYRHELLATVVIMSVNQLCGMNAITFYGASFLKKVFPPDTNIVYLTCSLSLCNVVSAMVVSPLFDRVGRKPLVVGSTVIMAVSSFAISVGLSNDYGGLTAATCLIFIFGYSIGVGPIVYLMVPEFTHQEAIGVGQSFGTVVNWGSNICIAYFFPKVENAVHGSVFYVFCGICCFYLAAIWAFVPETKGLGAYDDVWSKKVVAQPPPA